MGLVYSFYYFLDYFLIQLDSDWFSFFSSVTVNLLKLSNLIWGLPEISLPQATWSDLITDHAFSNRSDYMTSTDPFQAILNYTSTLEVFFLCFFFFLSQFWGYQQMKNECQLNKAVYNPLISLPHKACFSSLVPKHLNEFSLRLQINSPWLLKDQCWM